MSWEKLDASFLCLVIVARRLNIGSAYPFLGRSEFSSNSHTSALLVPRTGESLGSTVAGLEAGGNGVLHLTDTDELDPLSA